MSRRATAHERRSELRSALSRALADLLHSEEVEQLDVAAATSASSSVVQRWCDRRLPHCPSLADVVLIGESYPSVARGLLRWAAERLGLFVAELPAAAAHRGDDLELAVRVQRETSEAVAAHLGALASGTIERHEAHACQREVEEAIDALLTVRELMRGVAEGGPRAVRRDTGVEALRGQREGRGTGCRMA